MQKLEVYRGYICVFPYDLIFSDILDVTMIFDKCRMTEIVTLMQKTNLKRFFITSPHWLIINVVASKFGGIDLTQDIGEIEGAIYIVSIV